MYIVSSHLFCLWRNRNKIYRWRWLYQWAYVIVYEILACKVGLHSSVYITHNRIKCMIPIFLRKICLNIYSARGLWSNSQSWVVILLIWNRSKYTLIEIHDKNSITEVKILLAVKVSLFHFKTGKVKNKKLKVWIAINLYAQVGAASSFKPSVEVEVKKSLSAPQSCPVVRKIDKGARLGSFAPGFKLWYCSPLVHYIERKAKKGHRSICLSILKEFCFPLLCKSRFSTPLTLSWRLHTSEPGDIYTPSLTQAIYA